MDIWATMTAFAPLAGALLATTIVQQQALAVGDSGIAVYVMIVFLVQVSLGLPIATIALKKYFAELRAKGQLRDVVLLEQNAGAGINAKGVEKKPLIPPTPKDWQCEYTILFKMALVAVISAVFTKTLRPMPHPPRQRICPLPDEYSAGGLCPLTMRYVRKL